MGISSDCALAVQEMEHEEELEAIFVATCIGCDIDEYNARLHSDWIDHCKLFVDEVNEVFVINE